MDKLSAVGCDKSSHPLVKNPDKTTKGVHLVNTLFYCYNPNKTKQNKKNFPFYLHIKKTVLHLQGKTVLKR